jgi:predicted acetyltransferase
MTVTVTRAAPTEEPILQNLLQLYTHDFSEFWAGTPKGDLQPNGRFADYPLSEYWTNPHWWALLIWSDGVLAGFTLVNNLTHSGEPADHNMAEFFILRKHRGRGFGRLAAEIVFSMRPGSWEVAVARKNVQALSFWRRTIGGTIKSNCAHELDMSNEHWNGPILRFEWSNQKAPTDEHTQLR